jgi:hypothetical protein
MPPTPAEIFTFITVYYKHGAYDSEEFSTLREGLLEFLKDYVKGGGHEDGIRRQQLEALPDEELLTEILKLGTFDLSMLTLSNILSVLLQAPCASKIKRVWA